MNRWEYNPVSDTRTPLQPRTLSSVAPRLWRYTTNITFLFQNWLISPIPRRVWHACCSKETRVCKVHAGCNAHIRVWHVSCNAHSRVCNPKLRIKIYEAGMKIMHQRSCTSIVFFWPLQSKLCFCVPTWWMLALGWRSAILADNRCS